MVVVVVAGSVCVRDFRKQILCCEIDKNAHTHFMLHSMTNGMARNRCVEAAPDEATNSDAHPKPTKTKKKMKTTTNTTKRENSAQRKQCKTYRCGEAAVLGERKSAVSLKCTAKLIWN